MNLKSYPSELLPGTSRTHRRHPCTGPRSAWVPSWWLQWRPATCPVPSPDSDSRSAWWPSNNSVDWRAWRCPRPVRSMSHTFWHPNLAISEDSLSKYWVKTRPSPAPCLLPACGPQPPCHWPLGCSAGHWSNHPIAGNAPTACTTTLQWLLPSPISTFRKAMALYIALFDEHLDDLPTLNYASYHVAISCTIEHAWFKWAYMFIIIIAVYYLQLDVISYKRCK